MASSAPAKKPDRGKEGTPIQFKTNIYPLTIQRNISYFKHELCVMFFGLNGGYKYNADLTKPSRYNDDDCRREAKVRILRALAKDPAFQKKCLIYDRSVILYTLEELIEGDGELTFTLSRAALGRNEIFDTVQHVTVTLRKPTDHYRITSDDYVSAADADFIEGGNKSIYELLTTATSKCVVDYTDTVPVDTPPRVCILNPENFPDIEEVLNNDDQFLKTSIVKSVKTIENVLQNGQVVAPITAIAIDVSRFAMHKAELISTKLKNSVDKSQLIGLRVKKTYGNRVIHTIAGFTHETVANYSVTIGDKTMKLVDIIEQDHNIILNDTNLSAVCDTEGYLFAPELLMAVCERVKPEQHTAATRSVLMKVNDIPDDTRQSQIASLKAALLLDGERAKLMGVQLLKDTQPIEVTGRVLPSRELIYGKRKTSKGCELGQKRLFFAPRLTKWAFLVVSRRETYESLIDTLQWKGRQVGMFMTWPIYEAYYISPNMLSSVLGNAAAAGCTFALIIADADCDHNAIKAAEREYGIATLQIRGRTFAKAAGDIGSALVRKMNVKNGGLNHIVGDEPLLRKDHDDEDTLIIALHFDHPLWMLSQSEMEEGNRPTCPVAVGISSNAVSITVAGTAIPESSQNFTDKFAFANPREWKGEPMFNDTLSELIKHEIAAFKNGRRRFPQKIIIYVSGESDSERGYWSTVGKSLVNDVCRSFSQRCGRAITIITLSTDSCERFFVAEGNPDLEGRDPRTGFIVDSAIVNPTVNEWFQQTARAHKGTPRAVKYTLVAEPTYDKAKLTMDQLQSLTWSLAHLHQSCLCTIYLPAPTGMAECAAKRARGIFKYKFDNHGSYDLEELNTTFGFKSAGDLNAAAAIFSP